MARYGLADAACAERVAADVNALHAALAAAQGEAEAGRAAHARQGARHLAVVPDQAAANLMTTREVADLLGLSCRTVERRVADGRLTPLRIGRTVRFDPSEVSRFIAACAPPSRRRPQLVPRGRPLPPGERYW
jgi:excisionase family DNA binding protein